ncbi:MAG: peptidylprolyl isomerase [Pseudomonadota bacterium]
MMIALAARRAAAPLASFFIALASVSAGAQDADRDRVVARVDGEPVTQGEVIDMLSRMPPQYQQQPIELVTPAMVQQIGISREVYSRAQEAGLAQDTEVLEALEQAERGIMQEIWIDREVENQIDEATITAAYDTYLEQNPPQDEVSARHILLENEEDAVAVIEELDGGADFATLAQERSTGPSGPSGGQLGFFAKGQMVPEFADAAFALEPGSYSDAPVQSQFGWHVILVEDRRTTEPPGLEELRPQLENDARQQALRSIFESIGTGVDIVFLDAEGNEIETSDGDEDDASESDDGN